MLPVNRNRPEYRGISSWKDLVSITISRSRSVHLVGICRDGTVVAAGHESLYQSETYQYAIRKACDVFSWREICAVACGHYYTMGLKKDGTVVVTGDNDVVQAKGGIFLWRDIVSCRRRRPACGRIEKRWNGGGCRMELFWAERSFRLERYCVCSLRPESYGRAEKGRDCGCCWTK